MSGLGHYNRPPYVTGNESVERPFKMSFASTETEPGGRCRSDDASPFRYGEEGLGGHGRDAMS